MNRAGGLLAGGRFGVGVLFQPTGDGNGFIPTCATTMRCQTADEPVQLGGIEGDAGDFALGIAKDQLATLALVTDFNGRQ